MPLVIQASKESNKKEHREEKKQIQQQKGEKKKGYVKVYHWVAEKTWDPNSPFEDKTKLFNFIQHKILRNKKITFAVSPEHICESIGIDPKSLSRLNKTLVKCKLLIMSQKQYGLIEYRLHPERYGTDYITKDSKKIGKVIQENFPQPESLPEDPKEEIAPDAKRSRVARKNRATRENDHLSTLKSLPNSPLKNPLIKNPKRKNPSYENSDFCIERESTENVEKIDVPENGNGSGKSYTLFRGSGTGTATWGKTEDQIVEENKIKLRRQRQMLLDGLI